MALLGLIDTNRSLLAMTGTDAREVLQGVVTNDVDRVVPGCAVYAALLTPQGKYLSDFFLLDGSAYGHGDGSVLIDAPAMGAAALTMRLKMYCLRRDAAIAPADGGVALVWGEGAAPAGGVPDPRATALGWRIYGTDGLPEGVEAADAAAYDALRVALAIPSSGIELVPEDTYILEAGFERLSGVDFAKGCYVGQEVTARMKHKTELRKGLVRVAVSGSAAPGTPITAGGKPAGTLFTVAGDAGLAHLRLDRAGEGMQAGDAVIDYSGRA